MIEPINDENNTKVIIKILRVDWLNINSRKGAIFCKVITIKRIELVKINLNI